MIVPERSGHALLFSDHCDPNKKDRQDECLKVFLYRMYVVDNGYGD